ncbi:MAG: hypothetical protein IQL11_03010 [Bacteroidales bacterium]|nr:hypothetical protein [Bacteroidales bacterium]
MTAQGREILYYEGLGNKTYYRSSAIIDHMPYIVSIDYGKAYEMVASKDNGNSVSCIKDQ